MGGGGVLPIQSSRALSKSIAVLAHDFFEVVFLCRTSTGEYITARGSWELGESAGVSGVYRTEDGVNYGIALSSLGFSAGSVTLPASTENTGTAIIFAGKKTDKTLLAVGELVDAHNSDGTSTGKVISSDTKSVSFEINALKAGAVDNVDNPNSPPEPSAFWTNSVSSSTGGSAVPSVTTTWFSDLIIDFRKVPVFGVPYTRTTRASYEIKTHSSKHDFAFYNQGIIQAFSGATYTLDGTTYQKAESVRPKFTTWDDGIPHYGTYPYNSTVGIALESGNNQTAGNVFNNPIRFNINAAGTTIANEQDVLAITFQIPVYALSSTKTDTSDPDPVLWFIRPGYDNYRLELDEGRFTNGGAVLISIGQFASVPLYSLKMDQRPYKFQYNANASVGYVFSVNDSNFKFIMGSTTQQEWQDGVNSSGKQLKYYIDWNDNFAATGVPDSGYSVTVSGITFTADQLISPGNSIPTVNKNITIIVEYFDDQLTNLFYYTTFTINVSTLAVDFSNIPTQNRFVVGTSNDFGVSGGPISLVKAGTYLIVFTQSFDIGAIQFNITGDVILVITTTWSDLTIGRLVIGGDQATGGYMSFNGNFNVLVYFGTWPFNEPIMVGGDLLNDQPFRINTTGTYAEYDAGASHFTDRLIRHASGAGYLSTFVGPEIEQKGALLR